MSLSWTTPIVMSRVVFNFLLLHSSNDAGSHHVCMMTWPQGVLKIHLHKNTRKRTINVITIPLMCGHILTYKFLQSLLPVSNDHIPKPNVRDAHHCSIPAYNLDESAPSWETSFEGNKPWWTFTLSPKKLYSAVTQRQQKQTHLRSKVRQHPK